MSHPGSPDPPLAPASAGPPPGSRGRGLRYAAVVVVGLLVGLAAGWGGFTLIRDSGDGGEDRYVRGACQALADFQRGGVTWNDPESWRDDAFVTYHLWTAVIGYSHAAATADPDFDISEGSGQAPASPDLSRLDVDALADSEAALAELCADRGL
ncbi:hypothetical protein JQS43_24720 [Natronosporangium hydrolyticum]|uniref:Uncharacterized protein n=1 Tax=Natronosporangium hydrolyticum TaxID=2811111 RepID=A0A895YL86_9ACTN|nr:hypothetical protein [Natronosporangium hydrolyticum]QSB14628.1 hypothetical protein JQS43_24720 [Natronosporangium hydrolyticum]